MASKKKGLSLEEKRKKMMELFYESKDVFLLKVMSIRTVLFSENVNNIFYLRILRN